MTVFEKGKTRLDIIRNEHIEDARQRIFQTGAAAKTRPAFVRAQETCRGEIPQCADMVGVKMRDKNRLNVILSKTKPGKTIGHGIVVDSRRL